jgi:hypothetical protein
MSPQEKRHGVMARIRTSDLTIERRTLYHLSYPARALLLNIYRGLAALIALNVRLNEER